MSSIETSGGLNLQSLFTDMFSTVKTKAEDLQAKMTELKGADGNISQEDMLVMQFEINQYNMLLEMSSTVSKSITDEAKQLAQRAS
ncbi:MAG: EscF/YscF/HrpA family type III secretion system needle major subunit [Duodenibacillus sp.]|nr:EscF/YscF/HrpA family type III secretion system needle major subunit [Duodenibacillus sp.]